MKIEVGSEWICKTDIEHTVTIDAVGAFAVTAFSNKGGMCMSKRNDFLSDFKPKPEDMNDLISEAESFGFREGYAQAYNEFQTKTERERALQEKAWDEGYDQAVYDLIDEGVVDGLDEEEGYSEYEFGDVEDDEEEYCFSKELDNILNSEKAKYKVDPSVPSMGNRYDENGKLCGFFINTGNKKIGGITANTKEDLVNNPSHYNSDPSGVKCIEITRHRNNNIGNVIKYVWRNGLKDGNSDIQDLEKAAWYLNDEIQRLKDIER